MVTGNDDGTTSTKASGQSGRMNMSSARTGKRKKSNGDGRVRLISRSGLRIGTNVFPV